MESSQWTARWIQAPHAIYHCGGAGKSDSSRRLCTNVAACCPQQVQRLRVIPLVDESSGGTSRVTGDGHALGVKVPGATRPKVGQGRARIAGAKPRRL